MLEKYEHILQELMDNNDKFSYRWVCSELIERIHKECLKPFTSTSERLNMLDICQIAQDDLEHCYLHSTKKTKKLFSDVLIDLNNIISILL